MFENNEKLVTAHFTNDHRTHVKAFLRNVNGDVFPYTVEAEESSKDYIKLLEKISIDEIYNNTYKMVEESQQKMRDVVFEIGKEKGWLLDITRDAEDESKIAGAFFKIMFREDDDIQQKKERLFYVKMELFEQPFINKCKDRELKKVLRKAQTYPEVMQAALDIWNTTQAASSDDNSD